MMSGLAIISSDLVEMRNLTRKLNIGELFETNNPEDLARVINKYTISPEKLKEARMNAYNHARDEYNWENEQKRLINFYDKILV